MELKLLDENFEIMGDPIDNYTSLSYVDSWEENGSFVAVMPNDNFEAFTEASYVFFDGRTYEIEGIESGDELTVSGQTLDALLDRIVIYEIERLQGRLEERVRYIINKLAITGTQAIDKLVLETDNDYKRAMDAWTVRGPLGKFLREQLNLRGFSYKIEYDVDTDTLIFQLLNGADRSQDQDTNTTAIFSTDAGNIEKVTYKKNTRDYYNFAVVCNEDEEDLQTVEVDLSGGEPVRAMYVRGDKVVRDPDATENVFVMAGQKWNGSAHVGYVATSTDGISWTERAAGTTEQLWSLDYQNARFIAGGSSGDIVISSDGINWTKYESGTAAAIEGVGYIDGGYFLFTNTSYIGSSYDGQTFTPVYSSDISRTCINTALVQNKLIGFNSGVTNIEKLTSLDGYTWESETIEISESSTKVAIMRTSFDRGILCAAGYWYDGATYKPITITSQDNGLTQILTIIESLSGHRFRDMATGLGLFVAAGLTDIIAWSDDGITWTDCTPATAIDYNTITFDGGTFYAYGLTTHKVATSTDGKNWTVTDTNTTAYPAAVVYCASSYLDSLRQVGVNALSATQEREVIDGEILPGTTPIYGTDYAVGDIVDVKDLERDIMVTKRIIEVQHIREPSQVISKPKFGVDYLNLRKYIKQEVRQNG